MRIELSNDKSIEVQKRGEAFFINGEESQPDIIKIDEGVYHILLDGRGYRIEILDSGVVSNELLLKINGKECRAHIKNDTEMLLESLGIDLSIASRSADVQAPMPGKVIEVFVSPGESVQIGDKLLVLEAMKMENVIKASSAGLVGEINVSHMDSVEKGQVLLTFQS